MAEPAVGAVSLLLGVIRKEAALLGGVGADVQFIKEEMESMRSFLAHLARTAPAGGEHDEQVRTWMDQVRRLALDCNGCIDLYLYRGHREQHRASWGGLRRYLLWLPWLLQKMAAQHRAAEQLRELKDRARDISDRRSRYGVETPAAATKAVLVVHPASSPPPDGTTSALTTMPLPPSLWAGQVFGGGDEQEQDDGDDDDDQSEETWTDRSAPRGAAAGAVQELWAAAEGVVDLQDYLKRKLEDWMIHHVGVGQGGNRAAGSLVPSISIVAPHPEDAAVIADEVVLAAEKNHCFHVSVDIPAVHSADQPLQAKDILFYVLRELELRERNLSLEPELNKLVGPPQEFFRKIFIEPELDKLVGPQQEIFQEKERFIETMEEAIENIEVFKQPEALFQGEQDRLKGGIKSLTSQNPPQSLPIKSPTSQNPPRSLPISFIPYGLGMKQKIWSDTSDDSTSMKTKFKELICDERFLKRAIMYDMDELRLDILLLLLHSATADEQVTKKVTPTLLTWYDGIIAAIAKKLQFQLEYNGWFISYDLGIHLDRAQYARILHEVFPKTSNRLTDKEVSMMAVSPSSTSCADQLTEMTHKANLQILHEVQEGKSESKQIGHVIEEATEVTETEMTAGGQKLFLNLKKTEVTETIENRITKVVKKAQEKINNTKNKITELMLIKGIADKIEKHLEDEITDKIKKHLEDGIVDKIQKYLEDGIADKIQKHLEDGIADKIQKHLEDGIADKIQKHSKDVIADKTQKHLEDGIADKIQKHLEDGIADKIQKHLLDGIADKIQKHLKDAKTLIILKIDQNYVLGWEETRYALSLSHCVAGAVIVVVADNQGAKKYCCPPQEPPEYSIVGIYHDIVLQLTSRTQMNEENNSQILRGILDECRPHELCMKIFVHALYANPKRSKEDLHKLHRTLQEIPPKSFGSTVKKMLKFTYNNLPEEFKSCLLYLAIFPPRHCIRRSTLMGRWVTEGLITRKDWLTSVCQAERCFNALIDRCLVYPADIGATGKVKSCMVDHPVHEFIFKMASRRHIVEARLSNHLARHFSISNNLQFLPSQTIHSFLGNLSAASRLSLIKVLDLEGCRFARKGKHYLKGICSHVVLLKYLSLRRTDVKQLPNEINNLHELEVLDIRQTKVRMSTTESLLLLKLKRLLAGHNNLSQSNIDIDMPIRVEELSTVHIPNKIEKMVNMEVLSNVKARDSQYLRSIAKLWQLRKLGVVIDDKDSHLRNLLRTVSDLHECLHSLTITIVSTARMKATPSREGSLYTTGPTLMIRHPPKLESLSISGTTNKVPLLQLLLVERGNDQLTKVTLSKTYLSQNDLEVLAALPNLQCARLRHNAYQESKLTFKVDEFKHLKYFLVEGFNLTDIIFENGAAGELEKVVLPLSDGLNLSGVDKLTRLKEIELNNNDRMISSSNSSENNTNGITSSGNNINSITAATTNTRATTATNTDDTAPATENNAAAITRIDTTASNTPTTATASTPAATTKTPRPTADTTAPITTDIAATVTINPPDATIKTNMFLSLLENAKAITKVTLCDTMLKEDDLQILAKKPTICCLVLLNKSCAKGQLTFYENDFPKLSLLVLECDNMEVYFTAGSCPKLERFVWTFTKILSLSGIDNLLRLKEVEFKGDFVPNEVKETINRLKHRVHFSYYESEKQDQAEGNQLEEEDAIVPKFSCF